MIDSQPIVIQTGGFGLIPQLSYLIAFNNKLSTKLIVGSILNSNTGEPDLILYFVPTVG